MRIAKASIPCTQEIVRAGADTARTMQVSQSGGGRFTGNLANALATGSSGIGAKVCTMNSSMRARDLVKALLNQHPIFLIMRIKTFYDFSTR